ncbi:MAG: hypothetical protein JXX28_09660 [Deltaproteobacteria bacterium]|nr:hypothetical protein [Deltaproteobacteria bacterium]
MTEDSLPMLHTNAWRSSAWSILQGSPAYQGAKRRSFRHLFDIGWPAVYASYRLEHAMDEALAVERVQGLFKRIDELTARRETEGQPFGPFLKRTARSYAIHAHSSGNGLLPVRLRQDEVDAQELRVSALRVSDDLAEDLFDRVFAQRLYQLAVDDLLEEVERLHLNHWREVIAWRQGEAPPPAADSDEAVVLLYKVRQALRRHLLSAVRATLPPEQLRDPSAVEREFSGIVRVLLEEPSVGPPRGERFP